MPGHLIQKSKSKMQVDADSFEQNCPNLDPVDSSKFKFDIKKRAFQYALDTIKFIDQLDKKDLSVHVIARQQLRSATSIGANIIEAQASSSKREFTNFLSHSLKSANETKFWLALLRDSGKAKRESVDALLTETKELANILASSILTLKGKRKT